MFKIFTITQFKVKIYNLLQNIFVINFYPSKFVFYSYKFFIKFKQKQITRETFFFIKNAIMKARIKQKHFFNFNTFMFL